MNQLIRVKRWNNSYSPKRILVIRLQATGDVVITFPFVQFLKNTYPETRIDYLTRKSQTEIVRGLSVIDNVLSFTDSQNKWQQLRSIITILPELFLKRYDVVFDLQVSRFTTIIRQFLKPAAFTEFEKFTSFTAADRNLRSIQRSGLLTSYRHPNISLKNRSFNSALLTANGWDKTKQLIVLNPAGAFISRNWPIENYVVFAKVWLEKYPNYQFVMLGLEKIAQKAIFLQKELGTHFINLVGQTSMLEAFETISTVKLALSEDSGLMHMAWALKVPTIALIGSTDKNRSSQNGEHIISLTSDDLECGNCMKPICQFGEIPHCLSRHSPEKVVKIAEDLLSSQ